jgi:hypothetical protein
VIRFLLLSEAMLDILFSVRINEAQIVIYKEKQKNLKNNNMSTSSDDQHETKSNYFTPTIASKYVHTIFNSPSHNQWLLSLICDSLELQPGHTVVDMGCGPGLESTMILNKMKNEIHIIGKYCNVSERLTSKYLFDCVTVHSVHNRTLILIFACVLSIERIQAPYRVTRTNALQIFN